MIERLVADWLTNVDERGYQIPFCQVLVSRGHEVLHVSTHGPGEHGKDVIARHEDGTLTTYQLKKGDLTLAGWRSIRGEVEDLVILPADFPGIDSHEPHDPFLVLSGDLRGDARESIIKYAEEWVKRGARKLTVLPSGGLLKWFLDAHEAYLPTEISDFGRLVQLYTADPQDRISRADFSSFLESLVATDRLGKSALSRQRGIQSMALIAGYVISRYADVGNHLSVVEGWTIVAAAIFHVVERDKLAPEHYESTLALAWMGMWRALCDLETEVFDRETFVLAGSVLAEPAALPMRTTLILGWLAALNCTRRVRGENQRISRDLVPWFRNHLRRLRISTEADWPGFLCLAIWIGRITGATDSDRLLRLWVRAVVQSSEPEDSPGLPSPYWLPEKALLLRENLLPPHEREDFRRHSYTAPAALDALVRRLCRQAVAALWPSASRFTFCDFVPATHADCFLWRTENGTLTTSVPPQPASWSKWRKSVGVVSSEDLPVTLRRHVEWTLPFLLTYPHRANRLMSAYVDAAFGGRAEVR